MNFRTVSVAGLAACCLVHGCGGRALSDPNQSGGGGDTVNVAGAGLEGTGRLTIYFGAGDTNQGTLNAVSLSPDANQLSFQVYNRGYGPLVYKLQRTQ